MRSFTTSRYAEGIVCQVYRRARLVVGQRHCVARQHGNSRPAAARFPEMNVLVYHAHFDPRVAEEPFECEDEPDVDDEDPVLWAPIRSARQTATRSKLGYLNDPDAGSSLRPAHSAQIHRLPRLSGGAP
jgi:hypothetical protein